MGYSRKDLEQLSPSEIEEINQIKLKYQREQLELQNIGKKLAKLKEEILNFKKAEMAKEEELSIKNLKEVEMVKEEELLIESLKLSDYPSSTDCNNLIKWSNNLKNTGKKISKKVKNRKLFSGKVSHK